MAFKELAVALFLSLILIANLPVSEAKGSRKRTTAALDGATSTVATVTKKTTLPTASLLASTSKAVSSRVGTTRSPKGTGRRHHKSEKHGNRTVRQVGPFGFGGGFPSFGTGSGTAITSANALMGQSMSSGNTYTDPFGSSRSSANGFSSGYSPSTTSIATSNSQGANPFGMLGNYGRRKRQAFGYPGMMGTGSGSAITAANAAMGQSFSNGNTYTSPLGNSQSLANGFSSGYAPSTTSIANSNSQGIYGGSPFFGRKKRQAFGYSLGMPSFGVGSGTAITAANAAMGQSASNGNTYTDPFGSSRSIASGMSSDYSPSTTSIATSNSQGYPGMMGRRRKRQGFPPFSILPSGFPSVGASGTAIGTASAAQGTSRSSGNTFTSGGFSHSNAQGESSGYLPSTTSIATSNSGFNSGRRRRDTEAFAPIPTDTINHHEAAAIFNSTKVTDGKVNFFPLMKVGADHDMVADEHLDIEEGTLTDKLGEKRDVRAVPQHAYLLLPIRGAAISPVARQNYDYGPVLPLNYFQTPTGRNMNPQQAVIPQTPFWDPTLNSPFLASLQAANNAIQNSGGRGNMAGVVAVSANKPDGSAFANKLVDFNTPIVYPCSGKVCGTSVILTTPLPALEPQRDIRNAVTTSAPVIATTALLGTTSTGQNLTTRIRSSTPPTTEVTVVKNF